MLIRIASTLLLVLLFSTTTSAHSPDKVRKQAKKPQCEAFLKTPREEMDVSDPVARAMMKKCGVEQGDQTKSRDSGALKHGEHHH